ncbi:uncharacterized protein UTRI_02363 [Ustilago trichophora]|uniref:GPI-anchored wall transfer protein 1 n=1 Tax=Ustilago trichophora TaxID=86804 RepID=A0A5C3EA84_9BASI|nr:uncharacterized protein UTRI_02363 [Ustilago trichophora]
MDRPIGARSLDEPLAPLMLSTVTNTDFIKTIGNPSGLSLCGTAKLSDWQLEFLILIVPAVAAHHCRASRQLRNIRSKASLVEKVFDDKDDEDETDKEGQEPRAETSRYAKRSWTMRSFHSAGAFVARHGIHLRLSIIHTSAGGAPSPQDDPLQLLHSRDGSDAQSIVSASSAMSPLARSVVDPWGKEPAEPIPPLRQQIVSDFKKSLPLLLLGSVRVIMVKGVEYPEHVTEYGVHWNFFITLALLPFAGTLSGPSQNTFGTVSSVWPYIWPPASSEITELQEWALSSNLPRNTLLRQNKEGLTSMVGYLAIFYIGLDSATTSSH